MKESNPFWYPIQNALLWAKAKSVFGLVLIAAVFPVVECVFVNLWTSSPKETANPIFVVLAVIVGIHCVFVLMAILEEARSRSETVLPKAFQLQEDSDKLLRELKRREMTNKLVREAFDRLNVQTCQIELSPTSDAWCLGGFNNALWPILSPFTDNVDKALGVHGTRFSLEVYFTPVSYTHLTLPTNSRV